MRTAIVAFSLSSLVAAYTIGGNAQHNAYVRRLELVERQVVTSSAPLTSDVVPTTTIPASSAPAVTSASVAVVSSGVITASNPIVTASVTVSSASVSTPASTIDGNYIPPLSALTAGGATESPLPLHTTFAAGATPPISGAPALPTLSIAVANYPALDKIPPTDSAEVAEWMKELEGHEIPTFSATIDGSCGSDPALAADKDRCWWTCGGCTRDTDITVCPDKMSWGVSYDDGPSPYTPKLLNYLTEKDLQATFFVVGSRVISRPDMLRTEYMLGHEISIHTWSHHPLTTMTTEQIVAELGWTRKAIKEVLGVTPNTMRPPYGDIDDRVRAISHAMGLTPVIWTSNKFDTKDWQIASGAANGTSSYEAWKNILTLAPTLDTGFITLMHDLYQESTDMSVGYFLPDATSHNPPFKLSPIIECLNQPASNAYSETTLNKTVTTFGGSTGKGGSGSSAQAGGAGALQVGMMSAMSMGLVAGLAVLLL